MVSNFKLFRGFTLIELMVVIVLFSLVGVLGVNFLATILRGSSKAAVINEIKQNGSYATGIMERFIRNAQGVTDDTENLCAPAGGGTSDSLSLLNQDGTKVAFRFFNSGGSTRLVSYEGGLYAVPLATPVYLTNNDVVIQAGTGSFECTRVVGQADRITIKFTLEQKPVAGVSLPQEKKASVPFQTSVSLRNY